MTSVYGFFESYDYKYMYDQPDWRDVKGQDCATPGSIWDKLITNKKFSKFKYMVELAGLNGILNNCQSNVTVFIPEDKYLLKKYPEEIFANMDHATARNLVLYHMLDRQISKKLLMSTKQALIYTRLHGESIFVKTFQDHIILNKCARVVQADICCNNGLIHIVDDILIDPPLI